MPNLVDICWKIWSCIRSKEILRHTQRHIWLMYKITLMQWWWSRMNSSLSSTDTLNHSMNFHMNFGCFLDILPPLLSWNYQLPREDILLREWMSASFCQLWNVRTLTDKLEKMCNNLTCSPSTPADNSHGQCVTITCFGLYCICRLWLQLLKPFSF